jgi:hypothetical protein
MWSASSAERTDRYLAWPWESTFEVLLIFPSWFHLCASNLPFMDQIFFCKSPRVLRSTIGQGVMDSWLWLQLLRSNMKLSFIDRLRLQHWSLVLFYIIASFDEGFLPPHCASTVLLLWTTWFKIGIHLQYARACGHFIHSLITSRLILEALQLPRDISILSSLDLSW